jgi:hypothetical protein
MTSSEYKSAIAIDLANQNVNALVHALAEAKAQLDDALAKLKAVPTSADAPKGE